MPIGIKYVGVDIIGDPDIMINLERDKLKIFDDNNFHTVICTEVLEHLDHIHEVFDELCRVAKNTLLSRYLIIG